jgi:hypothetical protein
MGGFQAVVGLTMWRRQANSAMTRANFGFGPPRIKATPGKRADEGAHWTRSSSLSPSIASNFSWRASRTPHQINGTRAMTHLPGAKCRFRSFGKCQQAVVLEQDLTAPSSVCGKPARILSSFGQAPACRRSSFVAGAAFANGIPAPIG